MNARLDTGQVYAHFSSIQEKPVEWLWYWKMGCNENTEGDQHETGV